MIPRLFFITNLHLGVDDDFCTRTPLSTTIHTHQLLSSYPGRGGLFIPLYSSYIDILPISLNTLELLLFTPYNSAGVFIRVEPIHFQLTDI